MKSIYNLFIFDANSTFYSPEYRVRIAILEPDDPELLINGSHYNKIILSQNKTILVSVLLKPFSRQRQGTDFFSSKNDRMPFLLRQPFKKEEGNGKMRQIVCLTHSNPWIFLADLTFWSPKKDDYNYHSSILEKKYLDFFKIYQKYPFPPLQCW